ncbi:MAG TPA: metalloregulator ArsR/SmtB family transcription factor [Solirubrobacterales bacterium]|nr:metalloregulator ArsR/SmtB family transcription factor [Solirubrobacterales bacterium]
MPRAARKSQAGTKSKGGAGPPEPIHQIKAEFFRTLGHPARVRILELLRDGELSVGKLQAELGIDSSGASQHLAAMRRQGLLESRREGTSVFYRVRDPRVFQLLETTRQLIGSHLEEAQALLGELDDSPPASRNVGAKRR